ncbi:type IV secretory system conjugative DNA transfer family protein (plasmid) [Xanthomonas campestris pv. passiflorae]
MTLEDAQRLYDRPAHVSTVSEVQQQKNEAANAHLRALTDTALGVGLKSGMAWQLYNIEIAIEQRQRDLDTVYDFGNLLIRGRVLPAVITEARDLYNQDGDYALRLSGAYYKIEAQPRFSSVAPSWRDYLTFPKITVDRSISLSGLTPRDGAERRLWAEAVEDGWRQGVKQANVMLEHGLDRMNRDFTGMLRFHTFVRQGKITMPAIASETIPVTQSGNTMAVDETLLRITTLPEFNGNMATWRGASVVQSPTASPTTPVPVPAPTAPAGNPK